MAPRDASPCGRGHSKSDGRLLAPDLRSDPSLIALPQEQFVPARPPFPFPDLHTGLFDKTPNQGGNTHVSKSWSNSRARKSHLVAARFPRPRSRYRHTQVSQSNRSRLRSGGPGVPESNAARTRPQPLHSLVNDHAEPRSAQKPPFAGKGYSE